MPYIKELEKYNLKINLDEVLIRELIAEEIAAVASYLKKAIKADNEEVAKLFRDIANEEKVHAGELIQALKTLGIYDDSYLEQGAEEASNILKDI